MKYANTSTYTYTLPWWLGLPVVFGLLVLIWTIGSVFILLIAGLFAAAAVLSGVKFLQRKLGGSHKKS